MCTRVVLGFIAYVTIAVLGTLNHFWYDLSNENDFVALFAATDESVFQHMKMPVYPWLLFLFLFDRNSALSGVFGLLVCIALIPTMYYSALSAGHHSFEYDIFTFMFSILCGIVLWFLFTVEKTSKLMVLSLGLPLGITLGLVVWFAVCTYYDCEGSLYNYTEA